MDLDAVVSLKITGVLSASAAAVSFKSTGVLSASGASTVVVVLQVEQRQSIEALVLTA